MLWPFLFGQATVCQQFLQIFHVYLISCLGHDTGANAFSQPFVGHRNDSDLQNSLGAQQDFLNFPGGDVFSASNDDVLFSVRNDQRSRCRQATDIASAKVPSGREGVEILLVIAVTQHHGRSSRENFPIGIETNIIAVLIDNYDVIVGDAAVGFSR